jgi:hypothetical protein
MQLLDEGSSEKMIFLVEFSSLLILAAGFNARPLFGMMLCLAESAIVVPEKTFLTKSRVPVMAATQPPSWDPTIRLPHGNPRSGRRKALPSSRMYARAFQSCLTTPVEGSRGRAGIFVCHDATVRHDVQTAAKRTWSYREEQQQL